MLRQLENELTETRNTLESQERYIIKLELEKANYKALFYRESYRSSKELQEKLQNQLDKNFENRYNRIKSLQEMFYDGTITQKEYDFCMGY